MLDLIQLAHAIPDAWRSRIVGEVGNARVKVLRMDASSMQEEAHEYTEMLLVLDGTLELTIGQEHRTVRTGEMAVVAACTPHAVRPGSSGTLLIVDTVAPD